MELETKLKLISNLSKMDEGKALLELLNEYSIEVGSVSNIPDKIIESGGQRLSEETLGRIIAKKYIDSLIKKLTTPRKIINKQIVK
jgi:hypothetical protein